MCQYSRRIISLGALCIFFSESSDSRWVESSTDVNSETKHLRETTGALCQGQPIAAAIWLENHNKPNKVIRPIFNLKRIVCEGVSLSISLYFRKKNQINTEEYSEPSIIYYAVLIQDQILNFLVSDAALTTFLLFRCYCLVFKYFSVGH